MIDKRTIQQSLAAGLPEGVQRKGSTWRLVGEDAVGVINLQKSNYDSSYFLNLGFWLRELGSDTAPREEQCHVRARADRLWRDGSPSLRDVLTEDADVSDDVRGSFLRDFSRTALGPFLSQGLTKAGLAQIVQENDTVLVRRTARSALGLPD